MIARFRLSMLSSRVLSNSGWLVSDNVVRLLVAMIISIWLARYFGPELFGIYSFVGAFLYILVGVTDLGLNQIVVSDLVRTPERGARTLGSAIILQVIAGTFAYIFLVSILHSIRPDEPLVHALAAIMGLALVSRGVNVLTYWFEARVELKRVVWARNTVNITAALVRGLMILSEMPLIAFAWLALVETTLIAVCYVWLYTVSDKPFNGLIIALEEVQSLLSRSWPLFLSGVAVVIYMRIDQVMLGGMQSDETVGLYSIAVRISEVWYFLPSVLMSSMFPGLLGLHQQSSQAFHHSMRQTYTLFLVATVCIALGVTLAAKWLITLMLGPAYTEAAGALAIHVWALPAVALGLASSRELIVENLQTYSLYRTIIGCIVNVLLNLAWIPIYGIRGAAMATVISYFVATFSLVFFSKTRPMVQRMLTPAAFWN